MLIGSRWYLTLDNRIAITGGDQCLDEGNNGIQTYRCTPNNGNQGMSTPWQHLLTEQSSSSMTRRRMEGPVTTGEETVIPAGTTATPSHPANRPTSTPMCRLVRSMGTSNSRGSGSTRSLEMISVSP